MADTWPHALSAYAQEVSRDITTDVLLKITACLVALALFAIGTNVATLNVKKFLRLFRRPTAEEQAIERLSAELHQKQQELAAISPSNEFAKYFRLERTVNKLSDELKLRVAKSQTSALVGSIRRELVIRIVCSLLAVSLAYYSSDLVLCRIPSTRFYPINWLLSFPNLSLSGDATRDVPVTLFTYIAMGIFVRSVYVRRRNSTQKQKLT